MMTDKPICALCNDTGSRQIVEGINSICTCQRPVALNQGHIDDISINNFSNQMKAKMLRSRQKGRDGWYDPERCAAADLVAQYREHLKKGDPVDIANYCMMIFTRGIDLNDYPPPPMYRPLGELEKEEEERKRRDKTC